MKAAQLIEYGEKDAIKINEVDKPVPGEGQVLVEVYASSVNPFDYKVQNGAYKQYIPLQLPATLGGDFAGVITELGEGVNNFEVGQQVFGSANAVSGQGSFAEYTPVKVSQLAIKPGNIDFISAGALPLTGASAYQALVNHINLQPGQKILIHGGAGGIGSLAIQIAKHIGAYVATTVSGNVVAFVTDLGADDVIDYKNEDFIEKIKDYDAVFDNVGGEVANKSYAVLKNGGTLVSMVEQEPNEDLATKYNVKFIAQSTKASAEILENIAELVDRGELKVNIDKTFTLNQTGDALEYLKNAHPSGKVVIQVKS